MLLVFSADTVMDMNISINQPICCFSVITMNRLKSLGYHNVNLLMLSECDLSELSPRSPAFLEKIDLLVSELSKLMEETHKMGFKEREWRYFLGVLGYHLLSVCMDRLYRLKKATEIYPDCVYLPANSRNQEGLIPNFPIDLVELLKTENYNAVLYTKAAEVLGLESIGAALVPVFHGRSECKKKHPVKNFFRSIINKSVESFFYPLALLRAKLVLQNPYMPKKICLKLFLFSFGKILILPKRNKIFAQDLATQYPIEIFSRTELLKFNQMISSPELTNFINMLLPWLCPISCFEAFSDLHRHALKLFRDHSKALFTASGWYYDEQFKHLAALYASSGKQIVSAPHGGGQFVRYFYHITYHELCLADHYYASGYSPPRLHHNASPLSPPKFFYLAEYLKQAKPIRKLKQELLYGLTSIPAFTIELEHPPEFFMAYLDFSQRFVSLLSPELKENLKIRVHREDLGWDIKKKLKVACAGDLGETLKFDSWDISFIESLQQSTLYICDHISTTYAEAFMINHPIVLFFDPEKIMLTQEAQVHFDLFEKVGVFHRTPESAAEHILAIQKSGIDAWWSSDLVQWARLQFCDDFALTSDSAFSDWLNAFRRLY